MLAGPEIRLCCWNLSHFSHTLITTRLVEHFPSGGSQSVVVHVCGLFTKGYNVVIQSYTDLLFCNAQPNVSVFPKTVMTDQIAFLKLGCIRFWDSRVFNNLYFCLYLRHKANMYCYCHVSIGNSSEWRYAGHTQSLGCLWNDAQREAPDLGVTLPFWGELTALDPTLLHPIFNIILPSL